MFDAHCHLQDPRLKPHLHELSELATSAGIEGVCCCGTHPGDWEAVARLKMPFPVKRAYGVHPWYSSVLPQDWSVRLETLLQNDPDTEVGEIGVDCIRKGDFIRQDEVFKQQLAIAARLGRGVNLHGAKAWGRLVEGLKSFAGNIPRIVVHGFSGSPETARELLAMGAYISFGAALCNPKARRVREAFKIVPPERRLFETDSPDMLPPGAVALGDGLNHPANLSSVLNAAAAIDAESSRAEIYLDTRSV